MDLAKAALYFVQQRLQRVAFAGTPQRHLGRAVDADEQNALSLEMAAQVKKQPERAAIRPLQIVDDQQERRLAGQVLQHPRILRKEVTLVQGRHRLLRLAACDQRLQSVE